MTTDHLTKKTARALADKTEQTYTRALWAVRAARGETDQTPWPLLKVDQKVRFAEERTSYLVQAVSKDGRFVACTRASNLPARTKAVGGGSRTLYTVIDMALGIRGTSDSWGTGFETREGCEASIRVFERGAGVGKHSEPLGSARISYRNWVWMRMHERQVDLLTARQVPWLAQVLSMAPERGYNDYAPRSEAERASRIAL